MHKLKKTGFLEGAFIATLCIIISKVLGIIYVIPFYKIIGEQGGTLYGYAYNIYNMFLIISSAGIPLAISKLTSEYNTLGMNDKKTRMYHLATKAIMIFSILSFLICALMWRNNFFFFGGGVFLGLHMWHREIHRLEVKLEL